MHYQKKMCLSLIYCLKCKTDKIISVIVLLYKIDASSSFPSPLIN